MTASILRFALVAALALCGTDAFGEPKTGSQDAASKPEAAARSIVKTRRALRPKDLVPRGKRARGTKVSLEEHLAEEITKIWSGRHLRRGATAIYVVDEQTGAPVFAVHEKQPMNPASNVKIFSTAAVLDVLGPSWRYSTRVMGPAADKAGVARGDVYILGTGDPTLSVRDLDELVSALKDTGIRRFEGDVVIGPKTIRDGVSRANIKIRITGSKPGKAPVVSYEPSSDYFKIKVNALTTKSKRGRIRVELKHVETDSDTGHYELQVWGRIRQGRTATLWRGVSRRATFTAHTFRAKLLEAGIEVTGGVRVEALDDYIATAASQDFLPVELASHESSPIAKLIARVNKPSNNFLADRLLMTAGAAVYGGLPTMEKGLDAMNRWIERDAGIRPDSLKIDTGSGLSYATRISAQQIVGALRAGAELEIPNTLEEREESALAPVFLESLAVAGSDGTLRRRFRGSPVRGKMLGKTGTLTGVIALSGFVRDGDAPGLCFAIVTNGNRHRLRNRVRKEHEALVEAMHGYLRERGRAQAAADKAGVAGAPTVPN